jgi:hypothetical protein
MMKTARLALIFFVPLLLASCLFPGKFTSTLDIRKDRSFTYTYVGEVFAADENAASAASGGEDGEADPAEVEAAKAAQEAKRHAAAEALAKEKGYRSVRYVGEGKFLVDYAISGRLDHGFVYPFNSDAEAIFPWIAIEVRGDGTVRVKAPAFGDEGAAAMPGLGDKGPTKERAGTFTLTTDAEVVMHNVEEGIRPGPVQTLAWTVTPSSKTVPTVVLRLN